MTAGGLGNTAAVFLPALRGQAGWILGGGCAGFLRRAGSVRSAFQVKAAGGVTLRGITIGDNRDKAVVIAHPAIVGYRNRQVLSLAVEIARSFTAFLFDFRGHGRSSGRCRLGFSDAASDLGAVVEYVIERGFEKVGIAGFSLGGAAAFLHASTGGRVDSLVSIGCPPTFPNLGAADLNPRLSRAALRLLGMRVDPAADNGPSPAGIVDRLGGFPKFLIFGEWEVAPPGEIEAFANAVPGPSRVLTVPGVWHADLAGREALVREWFLETL